MPRKPYSSADRMASRQKLLLACLVSAAATQSALVLDLLDGALPDDIDIISQWYRNQTLLLAQLALVVSAAEPFLRPKIRYSIGPEKYSFERIERQFGNSAARQPSASSRASSL